MPRLGPKGKRNALQPCMDDVNWPPLASVPGGKSLNPEATKTCNVSDGLSMQNQVSHAMLLRH